ncbi:hypothetical protein [Gilliamella sp. Occ3-1]|uniref:hypothetical protein n=1 Tax=Gilliamella sp. Occ3-1 TaxID=3120253 RepID=UPI003FA525C8
MVSRPTIYNVLKKARLKLFVPLNSKNEYYKTISYGIKRLFKVEKAIEDKLRRQAKPIPVKCYTLIPNVYLYLKMKQNSKLENIYLSALMIFHVSFMPVFTLINPNLAVIRTLN